MKPYYEQDDIVIFNADCRDVLPTLEPGSVDLVLTDPPYGTTACAWDSVIPLGPMWWELYRVARLNAAVVLFAAQPFTSALVTSNLEDFRYCWVWAKDSTTGFLDANRKPLRAHEDICVFYRRQPTYNPQKESGAPTHSRKSASGGHSSLYGKHHVTVSDTSGMKFPRSVLQFSKNSQAETLHPTQKPIGLIAYLVRTYSDPGAAVLDFAAGSGTTLRAAKDLGRRAIGIEIEERYCEIAANRLRQGVLL